MNGRSESSFLSHARRFLGSIRGERLAMVLLVVFFLISLGRVFQAHLTHAPSRDKGEIVLRLSHWQLETDCRAGFDWLAEEYRKVRPNVRVEQLAIGGNSGAYTQWVSTQILGNTAPDIIERPHVGGPVLVTYCSRYFVPLGRRAAEPNPWNAGTDLEGVALRDTFVDRLRSSYVPELLDFYGLPMTIVNCRLYYNRDLLERLTGLSEPPRDLRSFLEVCEEIKRQRDERGRAYIPIAGSRFSFSVLSSWVMNPLAHKAIYLVDGSMDGYFDGYPAQDELFFAWAKGDVTFREAPYRLAHRAMREVTEQFQEGWTGMDRDQSLFIFTQGRAVFIPTGTWDYRSLASQAPFELAVCEIPVPSGDDPVYGEVVAGPVFETPQADARFVVNKNSPYQEEAMEFLLWFMSQPVNEAFCRRIGWLPSIRGAEVPPEMVPFQPRQDGVQGGASLAMGNQTGVFYEQNVMLYWLRQLNQGSRSEGVDDYDLLVDRYVSQIGDWGRKDYMDRVDDMRRQILSREATSFNMRGRWLSQIGTPAGERARRNYLQYFPAFAGMPNYVSHRLKILKELDEETRKGMPSEPTPTPSALSSARAEGGLP